MPEKKRKNAPGAGRPTEFDYERINVGPFRVRPETKDKFVEICEKTGNTRDAQFEKMVSKEVGDDGLKQGCLVLYNGNEFEVHQTNRKHKTAMLYSPKEGKYLASPVRWDELEILT